MRKILRVALIMVVIMALNGCVGWYLNQRSEIFRELDDEILDGLIKITDKIAEIE